MIPKFYLDLKANAIDSEIPCYAVLGKAVHVLHGSFSKNEHSPKFAICFPTSRQGSEHRSVGDVIRIFASSSIELLMLLDSLKDHHLIRDYTSFSMPKEVPDDFDGTWSVWRRIRVQKKEGINREKTIARAATSLFVEMRSSSGHSFPLRVLKETGLKQGIDVNPNSYGLASSKNLFSLPDIL